ncbi:sugar-binding transcriptional regulator [Streptococcus sanguinis]|uniref:sugar-binding transcriptional regulator n=1 Tax=Streptococcus sanguinis TaxID=1305 RepID=UPI000F69003D|nr:sugar-binding transcriptional regulator [Streptococcus sanguinis]MCY7016194.1 sugar-binding transcriptional regulator [Streptococcus sanguinis]RSI55662.1 Sorbitol operon regulator [Streptococcus sanguinis]
MKNERKKLLAKIAYLYYIEERSQSYIAAETGIYRTTISRMLAEAKKEGIVKIEIEDFDTRLFHLENYVKEKYGLKGIEIVSNLVDESPADLEERLAQAAAGMLRGLIKDNDKVGFSWGKSLSLLAEHSSSKHLTNVHFFPLAGGPSHIHARYHVNTLIYSMAGKYHGDCRFINSTIIQEDEQLTNGILASKYFEDLKSSWQELDVAVVGIGGQVDTRNRQWLDMLTSEDFLALESHAAVGEICCRFFNKKGDMVYQHLQNRTIAISLENLKKVPLSLAFAYGSQKSAAILAVLRAGYVNHLVTDEATILKMLDLDGDRSFFTS